MAWRFPAQLPARAPVVVGFSGGMDSTVLLHWLSCSAQQRHCGLTAIHVHHGLQPAAQAWGEHCQRLCDRWQIPLTVVSVAVNQEDGLGLEAAARQARRRAFAQRLPPNHWLALAHHRDDQAETWLLRALRGSGVDGLAAMSTHCPFAQGQLWRPLLDLDRDRLAAYAQDHQLTWIEDPSNADVRFDRNYLRHQVMPQIRARWPAATATFARNASLCARTSALLSSEDAAILAHLLRTPMSLDVHGLLTYPPNRRARVVRHWCVERDFPPFPASGVIALEQQLLRARRDRQPCFQWQGVILRRWRDTLYLHRARSAWPDRWHCDWTGQTPLILPDGSQLTLDGPVKQNLWTICQVHGRRGGERMTLSPNTCSHALKHLLQEAGVPPWQRQVMPLLYDGQTLLAAGDQLISARLATWLSTTQQRLCWRRPDESPKTF